MPAPWLLLYPALNCFWANPVWFLAVLLSSLGRPWKSKQISFALEADVLWKSFCLFSSMADSFLQQSKGFNLVRSRSQKLANWMLTREPLHKPGVILQDGEVPAAPGRISEQLSLLKHSEVVSLLSLVFITYSKCCCISLTFLQPPVGLTAKANEVSKEGSWVQTASGAGRAEGEWLPYAIHDCKSDPGRLPLSYQDKQNMSLLSSCNFPQCPELCRWQPGRGNRDSSAHTDGIAIHDCDRWGYLSKLSLYWRIWNVSYLRLPANNYCYFLWLQTPSKWRQSSSWVWCSNSSSSVKVCEEFIEPTPASRWTKMSSFHAHSFWTVVSNLWLYLTKDLPKPRCITGQVRLSRASVSTVTLKKATVFASQAASFVARDRWINWEYLGKDDQKTSAWKNLKEGTLTQWI